MGSLLPGQQFDSSQMAEKLIDEGYVAPYTGGNKDQITQIHLSNRQKLLSEGKVSQELYESTL